MAQAGGRRRRGGELRRGAPSDCNPALIRRLLSTIRPLARSIRRARHVLVFRLWARRLDLALRRRGGRLVLDAPQAPEFEAPPKIRAVMEGAGDGTLTLRIGRGVRFERGVTIEVWAPGTNVLEIGDQSVLGGCILQLRSGAIRAADHVQVREFSVVKSYGELQLGSRAIVSYSSVVHCERRVELGDLIALGERVSVLDSEKLLRDSDDDFQERPRRVAPVVVGRNTYVGAGAVITRGVNLGSNSVVAANAVVTGGDYPAGWLLGGVPARVLRPLEGEAASEAPLSEPA